MAYGAKRFRDGPPNWRGSTCEGLRTWRPWRSPDQIEAEALTKRLISGSSSAANVQLNSLP